MGFLLSPAHAARPSDEICLIQISLAGLLNSAKAAASARCLFAAFNTIADRVAVSVAFIVFVSTAYKVNHSVWQELLKPDDISCQQVLQSQQQ